MTHKSNDMATPVAGQRGRLPPVRVRLMQMEVFRRLRNGGQQFVRVEHVHVNDGGRAIIGNIKKADR